MQAYPKRVLSLQEQVQTLLDAGLIITSRQQAEDALSRIGYYRLRGYSYQWYDSAMKQYKVGTDFSNILDLYNFDTELSHTIVGVLSQIEIALKSRLTDALLQSGQDPLILTDPSQFKDKKLFWQNLGTISSEIARSSAPFIQHHYDNHAGLIPIWAAMEVISFGTLSKIIKNLHTGNKSAFTMLVDNYKYLTPKSNLVKPSKASFSSWVYACAIFRNICAHNGRLYNRAIKIMPEIIDIDKIIPTPQYRGVYHIILAMKYLRPNDEVWKIFIEDLKGLFMRYEGKFRFSDINFPSDWVAHL